MVLLRERFGAGTVDGCGAEPGGPFCVRQTTTYDQAFIDNTSKRGGWIMHRSSWKFETSHSYAASVGVAGPVSVVSGAQEFFLTAPPNKPAVFQCEFGGLSFGMSFMNRIVDLTPLRNQITKDTLKNVNVTGSTKNTFSQGWIYRTSSKELWSGDFEGLCLIEEVAVSVAKGGAATLVYFGLPVTAAGLAQVLNLSGTGLLEKALRGWGIRLSEPKAIMIMLSNSWGLQAGAGVSQCLGQVWLRGRRPEYTLLDLYIEMKIPPSKEDLSMRWSATQNVESIVIPGDVLFAFDRPRPEEMSSYRFDPDAEGALRKAKSYIESKGPRGLQIWGHTDSFGSNDYNLKLSRRRANAVKNWLLSNQVLDASKIDADGKGEEEPIASNLTPEGRQRNRRVEIFLMG
jgi:outer membrane protein OmpA-like peptidoglycan-associated protein